MKEHNFKEHNYEENYLTKYLNMKYETFDAIKLFSTLLML